LKKRRSLVPRSLTHLANQTDSQTERLLVSVSLTRPLRSVRLLA